MSRVRVTAKSGCMDINVVMPNDEATAFVKKLRRIQKRFIDLHTQVGVETYFSKKSGKTKTRKTKSIPDSVDQSFKIKIEPEGKTTD